jgi:hypothetical protein
MKPLVHSSIVSVCRASALACIVFSMHLAEAQAPAEGAVAGEKAEKAELPVTRVTLFSSGVGYFEHGGTIAGAAGAELRFSTGQINDVLKSLVLQDLDGGSVAAVNYPSLDPLAKTLGSFQINISENPPLADLINQIRGAQVSLSIGARDIAGTVVGVEARTKHIPGTQEAILEHYLNILSGGSIRSVALASVHDLRIHDPQLQEELNKALAAVAQARDQDKKPVTLQFNGEGERRVRAGYVVETPVWKTSYRLILQEDGESQLQGWAIVENQTDNDWNNVELGLVSGRPISFRQDLYQPLYLPRPEVTPEQFASLRPQVYEGGILQRNAAPAMPAGEELPALGRVLRRSAGTGLAPQQEKSLAEYADRDQGVADPFGSVTSAAAAEDLGELFQYTVGSVTLPRQQSSLIPIITDTVEIERLSIYNPDVLQRHPLTGVRLINKAEDAKHLLQGPVTVFDSNRYAGDARLDDTPPGQERLMSYGIDLNMRVDSKQNDQEDVVQTGSIVNGMLRVERKLVAVREYLANNKGTQDKRMLVEHPLRHGWKLMSPDEPVETTDRHYRFEVEVPAGGQESLTVREEHIQVQSLAILPADVGQLEYYHRTGAIPESVREALAKAIAMKHALVALERQIQERNQESTMISEEQNRIRENIKTVQAAAQDSDYRMRLLKKLDEQETRLETLQSERAELQEKFESQRAELENYLIELTVD